MINGRPSNGLRLNFVDCGNSLRSSRTPNVKAGMPHALLGAGFEGELPSAVSPYQQEYSGRGGGQMAEL
jgi:hypothetical protein